jgi:hypothetical protein
MKSNHSTFHDSAMTDQSTALTTTAQGGGEMAFLHDGQALEHVWRLSKYFAASKMVPTHFQQKPEDCMIALMMAQQLGVNPVLTLQNLQVINGRPGFSASFAIGLANQRGPFAGPITWTTKGTGDNLAVTAHATVKSTGEVVTTTVSMAMAKAEGWVKNPKYRSIPEQMLKYRAATWLIRLHCPEVLMGLSSSEELEDVQTVRVREETDQAVPASANVIADLNQQIKQRAATASPETIEDVQPPAEEPVEVIETDDPF